MQHFIGCDVHTRYQKVAWIDLETGEIRKRRLEHGGDEVARPQRNPLRFVTSPPATAPSLPLLRGFSREA